LSAASASALRPAFFCFMNFRTICTCWLAVSAGNRLKPWKMKPQLARRKRSILRRAIFQMLVSSAMTLPASGFIRPETAASKRRLARSGRAHDEHDLARLDQEIDALEHLDHHLAGLEALLDATRFDGPALADLFWPRRRRGLPR
jgi:hypothetical protein